MKKLVVLGMVIFCLFNSQAEAQVRIGVNLNLGIQPEWGPSGYDRAEYYYLPDVDAYYNVRQRQFIYMEGNNWVFRTSLPGRYRNYDLYNGYKVVVNEPKPYMRANYYRSNYGRYKNWHGERQVINRDRRDNRKDDRRDDKKGPEHDRGHGNH